MLYKKYLLYGLDSEYNYFQSGSDASLAGVISSAYEKGQPIVAYYWDPTWLLGKYDMVLLEDEPYVNVEDFKAGKTAFPSVKVTITASNNFYNNPENADFCEFLSNFHSSSALTNEALAYMQDNPGVSYTDTARWFLGQHPELLGEWLPEDKVELVEASLASGASAAGGNWFTDFPLVLDVDQEAIDSSVRAFSERTSGFFDAIKAGLTAMIGGIQAVLDFMPWWLMLGLVFLGGWKLCGGPDFQCRQYGHL